MREADDKGVAKQRLELRDAVRHAFLLAVDSRRRDALEEEIVLAVVQLLVADDLGHCAGDRPNGLAAVATAGTHRADGSRMTLRRAG